MRKYLYLVFGLILVTPLVHASPQDKSDDKAAAGRTLKVKLQYTGAGTVDEKHKIFIVLFDTADFIKGGIMPIANKSAAAKDDTVTFTDLPTSPVFAATSYDATGAYDGQSGPPPSGASLGMYSKTPGVPEPIVIEAGKTTRIELAFDDTAKMP